MLEKIRGSTSLYIKNLFSTNSQKFAYTSGWNENWLNATKRIENSDTKMDSLFFRISNKSRSAKAECLREKDAMDYKILTYNIEELYLFHHIQHIIVL